MNEICIVAGNFALVRNGAVIGVVVQNRDTTWAFWPIVPGKASFNCLCLPLNGALEKALEFQPD